AEKTASKPGDPSRFALRRLSFVTRIFSGPIIIPMNYSAYSNRLDRLGEVISGDRDRSGAVRDQRRFVREEPVGRRVPPCGRVSISLNSSRSACVMDRSLWCRAKNRRFGRTKSRAIREPALIDAVTTSFER